MNSSLMSLELAVLVSGLFFLLLDLWTAPEKKRLLGYGAAAVVGLIFLWSLTISTPSPQFALKKSARPSRT